MDLRLVCIIIPVYKAEKYFRRCLNSVKNQTYKNIEIILVDDGSPDNCPAICDEYAAKDSRFHVIHKENGGVSSARNAGINYVAKNERADYISFVDADDWLPTNAISKLVTNIETTQADFVCGNYYRFFITGIKLIRRCEDYIIQINESEKTSKIINGTIALWGALYRAEMIKNNNFFFQIDVQILEDSYFVFQYLKKCRIVSAISDPVYYYNRINEISITYGAKHLVTYDFNIYYLNTLTERLKLFDISNLPDHEKSIILYYFFVVIEHYVRMLPCEAAVQKIKETCEMYEQYLRLSSDLTLGNIDSLYTKYYIDNKLFINQKKYTEVYKYMFNKITVSTGGGI